MNKETKDYQFKIKETDVIDYGRISAENQGEIVQVSIQGKTNVLMIPKKLLDAMDDYVVPCPDGKALNSYWGFSGRGYSEMGISHRYKSVDDTELDQYIKILIQFTKDPNSFKKKEKITVKVKNISDIIDKALSKNEVKVDIKVDTSAVEQVLQDVEKAIKAMNKAQDIDTINRLIKHYRSLWIGFVDSAESMSSVELRDTRLEINRLLNKYGNTLGVKLGNEIWALQKSPTVKNPTFVSGGYLVPEMAVSNIDTIKSNVEIVEVVHNG